MACVIVFFMIIFGIAFYLDKKATETHSLHLTYGGNFKDRWVELFSQTLKERVKFPFFFLNFSIIYLFIYLFIYFQIAFIYFTCF